MLRRRSGVMEKKTGDLSSDSCFSSNSLEKLKNPGLFVGFAGKGLQDSDSLKSPTSPLDLRLFSKLSRLVSSGRSWDCGRVGLSLIDSLGGGGERKNVLLGSQMRAVGIPAPKSSNLSSISMASSLFSPFGSYEKIESCPDIVASSSKSSKLGSVPAAGGQLDSTFFSVSLPASSASIHGFMASLSASEIELSEDYTCIISHGPNPKTTRFFGDCILENYMTHSHGSGKKEAGEGGVSHWSVESLENSPPFPSEDFLSSCFFCKEKLEVGKDIYMYRGDKAFCSCYCREQEMLFEEEMEKEKPATCSRNSPNSSPFQEDLFL